MLCQTIILRRQCFVHANEEQGDDQVLESARQVYKSRRLAHIILFNPNHQPSFKEPSDRFNMLTTILSALLLSTVGNAASIRRRDEVWKAPKEGNLRIRFGDGKVNIGGCHAKDIIDTLNQHCKDGAGVCEPGPWIIECASDGPPWKIEVTTSDSQHDAKLKKGLIDALKAAIGTEKVEESREVIGATGGGCTGCSYELAFLSR